MYKRLPDSEHFVVNVKLNRGCLSWWNRGKWHACMICLVKTFCNFLGLRKSMWNQGNDFKILRNAKTELMDVQFEYKSSDLYKPGFYTFKSW